MRWWFAMLVGCGRIGFAPVSGGDDGGGSGTKFLLTVTVGGAGRVTSTPAGIDCPGVCQAQMSTVTLRASADPGARFVSWSGACDGFASTCDLALSHDEAVDAAMGPAANRVFVSTPFAGNLGGLQGADSLCNSDQVAAGLTGTFLAFLSATGMTATSRFAGSQGWVRVDGAPVVNTMADLTAGAQLNPIILDAAGVVHLGEKAWTGTDTNGGVGLTCAGWLSTTMTGSVGQLDSTNPNLYDDGSHPSCTAQQRVMCFEADNATTVSAVAQSGRIVFLSTARLTAGFGALDMKCSTEAQAASLPGTYLAAVATSTSTIASRFTIDTRPWIRPDGTRVAGPGRALFDQTHLSFVNQLADKTLMKSVPFTGATGPDVVGTLATTCQDWNSLATTDGGLPGDGKELDATKFWKAGTMLPCNLQQPVICLQE